MPRRRQSASRLSASRIFSGGVVFLVFFEKPFRESKTRGDRAVVVGVAGGAAV